MGTCEDGGIFKVNKYIFVEVASFVNIIFRRSQISYVMETADLRIRWLIKKSDSVLYATEY